MALIRIALIGLSQAAKTSWASQGHLPYLLSERGEERYKIAALLNSTQEAAKKAIAAYDLPSDVKAYCSPQDLAADPDIDLVVCTTRVDVHYDTIKPSVEAGKNVFVEWPLAENVSRASELANLARQSGSTTLTGLQARVAPAVLKVKELIGVGTIGKVLSSDVQAFTPGGGGDSMTEGLAYFLDKKVGGNPVTIAFGHSKSFSLGQNSVCCTNTAYSDRLCTFSSRRVYYFECTSANPATESEHRQCLRGSVKTNHVRRARSRIGSWHARTVNVRGRGSITDRQLPKRPSVRRNCSFRMDDYWREGSNPHNKRTRSIHPVRIKRSSNSDHIGGFRHGRIERSALGMGRLAGATVATC